jgi:hypothetical protein
MFFRHYHEWTEAFPHAKAGPVPAAYLLSLYDFNVKGVSLYQF